MPEKEEEKEVTDTGEETTGGDDGAKAAMDEALADEAAGTPPETKRRGRPAGAKSKPKEGKQASAETPKAAITEGADDKSFRKKVELFADKLIKLGWFTAAEREDAITTIRGGCSNDVLLDVLIAKAAGELSRIQAAGATAHKADSNVPCYSGTLEEFHLAKDTVTLKISTTTPEAFATVGLLYKTRVNIAISRQTTGQQAIPFNDSPDDEDDDAGAAHVDAPLTTDGAAPSKPEGFEERNPIADIVQEACDVIDQACAATETMDIPQGDPEPETVGGELDGLDTAPPAEESIPDTTPAPVSAPAAPVVPSIDLSTFGL